MATLWPRGYDNVSPVSSAGCNSDSPSFALHALLHEHQRFRRELSQWTRWQDERLVDALEGLREPGGAGRVRSSRCAPPRGDEGFPKVSATYGNGLKGFSAKVALPAQPHVHGHPILPPAPSTYEIPMDNMFSQESHSSEHMPANLQFAVGRVSSQKEAAAFDRITSQASTSSMHSGSMRTHGVKLQESIEADFSLAETVRTMFEEQTGHRRFTQTMFQPLAKLLSPDVTDNKYLATVKEYGNAVNARLDRALHHPQHSLCARLVQGSCFESIIAAVILANALTMGLSADYKVEHHKDSNVHNYVENSFTVFYLLELLLRISVYQYRFFCCPEWMWNSFDFSLVVLSVAGMLISMTKPAFGMDKVAIARTLRLVKMFKLLRMFRMLRAFKELRLLLNAISGSVKSMVWSMGLVVTVAYVCAIMYVEAGASCLLDTDCNNQEFEEGFREYWDTVLSAMLSLYMASTGGIDWISVAKTWRLVGVFYYLSFLVYIAFFNFVILNTLTSLFLEATLAHAEKDESMIIHNEIASKEKHIRRIKGLFNKIADGGESGIITAEDLKKRLGEPWLYALASSMGIDAMDVEQFFNILSADGTQPVDIDSFVVGCMKMRGPAKNMDLLGLIYTHTKFMNDTQENFRVLSKRVTGLGGMSRSIAPMGLRAGSSSPGRAGSSSPVRAGASSPVNKHVPKDA